MIQAVYYQTSFLDEYILEVENKINLYCETEN